MQQGVQSGEYYLYSVQAGRGLGIFFFLNKQNAQVDVITQLNTTVHLGQESCQVETKLLYVEWFCFSLHIYYIVCCFCIAGLKLWSISMFLSFLHAHLPCNLLQGAKYGVV
jgi:hypothetical protein